MIKVMTLMFSFALITTGAHFDAVYAASKDADAKAIMQNVLDRDDGDSQYSHQTVATCRYAKKGKGIACADKPRIKAIESLRKDYGDTGKDRKSISIILEPSAEKGIGFLQYDYEDQEKDSDQWMYLSALGKVKRIISGKSDEPKTGSLFGSEISYEDVEITHIDDFTYTLTKEEKYTGRDCWVIESLPKPEHARKSNYSKSIQWIDKERLISLRVLLYDRRGRALKQMTQSDLVLHDGIWIAKKLNMNNVQTKRITTMKLDNISINLKLDDSVFTQRTLTDGAFRESMFAKVRESL